MRAVLLAASLLTVALPAAAQRYAGTYTAVNAQGAVITLQLAEAGGGRFSGTLSGPNIAFQIEAQPGGVGLVGVVSAAQGRGFMEARLDGDQLTLVVAEAGADGNADRNTAQQLVFTRGAEAGSGAMGGGAVPAQPSPPGGDQPGALDDGTPLGREWSQGLAGRKLTRISSYSSGDAGGYSAREELTLCSNGEYLYRGNSSVSVDVGGASGSSGGASGDTGRWRVVTQGQAAGLELRAQNGQVTLVRLAFQENLVHIDGGKVYRTAAEVCQ